MNILHLTDFHFKSETDIQNRVLESIIDKIKKDEIVIDFVFFTGDLVQDGIKIDTFQKASQSLFTKLVESLGIIQSNIIICAGNHDISRTAIHKGVKAYIQSDVINNDKLNDFYSKKDEVFADSLKPIANFNTFIESFYTASEENDLNDLYSIFYREYDSRKIAITTLNSAWLSTGDDYSNLYIPLALLNEINIKIKKQNVHCKIILFHHPLYFLKEYNFTEVETFIHKNYDLMFTGHVHKSQSSTHYLGNNGIYDHVAKASLSSDIYLGCSIIKVNEEKSGITVRELSYDRDSDNCETNSPIVFTIPCGEEKHEQNLFRTKIHEKVQIELSNANELLLIDETEEQSSKDFLTLFNKPIIKDSSFTGLDSKSGVLSINFDTFYTSTENFIVFGKDKSGKTSFLKRIQIELLISFSKIGLIPFFLDCKELETKIDEKYNLKKQIASYYSINQKTVDKILESSSFRLLVDNFTQQSSIYKYLDKFINENPKVSYIICSNYNVKSALDSFTFGESTYKKMYIYDITRKEIAKYTEKHFFNKTNQQEVQEKIVKLCKQLELPLNYWTISLLLLICKKSNDDYHKNIYEILDLCVDEVLQKKILTLTRSKVGFDQLKRICSELAHELYINFSKEVYSATQIEIVRQIDLIIKKNNRISADSSEIFDYLLSTGILKLKEDRTHYTFRLNGFFEYFLAFYMTKNEKFKEKIIQDDNIYITFKNEFEIYSGFKRNDLALLEKLYAKTQIFVSELFAKYKQKPTDQLLIEKLKEPKALVEKIKRISIPKALSNSEISTIGDMLDPLDINADVHIKEPVDLSKIDSDILERYLSVLARVYRNSDEIIEANEKLDEIFDFILDSYCYLGFFILDEFSDIVKKTEINDIGVNNEIELLNLVSNFTPIISEISLFDGIGHYNLEFIIKKKIETLKVDADNNQLKLFMLYFLLIDIDLKNNKERIEEVMDVIKVPFLKMGIFVKLNYYLAFKANSSTSLQQYLENKIQIAKLNIDPKTDHVQIQKDIYDTKKLALLQKGL